MPSKTKGKITLKHAGLSNRDRMKVETWLKGNRDVEDVMQALAKLDTDDSGGGASGKSSGNFYGGEPEGEEVVQNDWEADQSYLNDGWHDKDDMGQYYENEGYDGGPDSEDDVLMQD